MFGQSAPLLGLGHRIRAQGLAARGRDPEAARQLDVLLERLVGLLAQALDFFFALERARVDHAHRQDHHAADVLGLSFRQFRYLMKKHGLKRE